MLTGAIIDYRVSLYFEALVFNHIHARAVVRFYWMRCFADVAMQVNAKLRLQRASKVKAVLDRATQQPSLKAERGRGMEWNSLQHRRVPATFTRSSTL